MTSPFCFAYATFLPVSMILLGAIYDLCPLTDQIGMGEQRFELYHVKTLAGPTTRKLKKMIASVFNSDTNDFYSLLKPIEREFNLKYWGRIDMINEHSIAFVDKETRQPVVFKVSRLRKSSLAELAAQKVASELGDVTDVETIIGQCSIPATLRSILLRHL